MGLGVVRRLHYVVSMAALAVAACSTVAVDPTATGAPAASPSAAAAAPASPAPAASLNTSASPPIPAPPGPRTILVDTDVAADDLVALTFLIRAPHVELVAITVSGTGEAHCAGGVDVVLRLLDRLHAADIPVACGRETPLEGAHAFPDPWREHVDAGAGLELAPTARKPSEETAVELISRLSEEHKDLGVLTLGPLTNLADALLADTGLADRLGTVHVMGGALYVPGNLVCCGAPEGNAVAEWNIYVDPRAAQVVVDGGVVPRLVSLDGTNQVPVTPAWAQTVLDTASSPAAKILTELFAANPFMTDGSYYLWDPLAAQLAAGYPVGSFSPAAIDVEEAEGRESGFTRPIAGDPNVAYLSTVDPHAAESTLLGVLNAP